MKNKITFILFFIFLTVGVKAQIITTVAGDSTAGYNGDNIPAVASELDHPIDIAVDSSGNLYISDTHNNRIRKVNTSGVITTIAGTGVAGFTGDGGPATNAEIFWPYGLALDKNGNVYFADAKNSRVRKIDTSGVITTIVGTGSFGYNGDEITATLAELNSPGGVAIDGSGNIYIADGFNNRIRKIDTSGIITTYAGNGTAGSGNNNVPATDAEVNEPYGITLDNTGNLYIACYIGAYIYKVDTLGIFNIIAGTGTTGYGGDGGPATTALLSAVAVAADISGNIYIADPVHSVVRIINTSGIISTIAGTGIGFYNGDDQPATSADLYQPTGVAVNAKGSIYIADYANNRIRYVQNTLLVNTISKPSLAMEIYPNPNRGHFLAFATTANNEPITISISDVIGEQLKEITAITNQPTEIRLNAPPGVYLLSATCADGDWSGRIVIE